MYQGDIDRPRGILTQADREFLVGEREYDDVQTERNTRARIRNRLREGILDLALLHYTLHERDLDLVFQQDARTTDESTPGDEREVPEVRLATTDAFALLYRGLRRSENEPTRRHRLQEAVERAVVADGQVADVDIGVDVSAVTGEEILRRLESGGFDELDSYHEFEKVLHDPDVDPERLARVLSDIGSADADDLLPEHIRAEREGMKELRDRRYEP